MCRRLIIKIILLGLALPLFSGIAVATEFYKWRTEDGSIQYGTNPPAGVEAREVKTNKIKAIEGGDSATQSKEKIKAQKELEEAKKEDKDFQEKLAEAQKRRKAACQRARQAKIELSSRNRIRQKQADGSYKMLAPEDKQKQISLADKQIREYCK